MYPWAAAAVVAEAAAVRLVLQEKVRLLSKKKKRKKKLRLVEEWICLEVMVVVETINKHFYFSMAVQLLSQDYSYTVYADNRCIV
jgi:hypothetical protein